MVKHHLKQGLSIQAAFRPQHLYQLLKRQVRVGLGIKGHGARLRQQLGEWHSPIDSGAQYLRVNKETDDILHFGPVAAGNRHANAQFTLAGIAKQQRFEGRKQRRKQGSALSIGLLSKRIG